MINRPQIFLAIALLFVATWADRTPAANETTQRAELQKYAEAEKYVLEQIALGNIPDLSERFKDDEQKRILPASFVEALLINPGKFNIHRHGVLINGARIVGSLNLANSNIETFVFLTRCQFDDVFFFQTVFKKGLTISGSTFLGDADFSFATVMEAFTAEDVKFLNPEENVNLDYIKVKGPFALGNSTFAGPASFLYATIDGAFQVKNAQFTCKGDAKTPCKETKISFNSMQIGRGVFAQGANFERPVDLVNLRANDNFEGEESGFKASANFSMMKLGHNLFLSGVKFGDDVSFNRANIAGSVDLTGVQFQPGHEPDLSNTTYLNIYPTRGLLELIENSVSDYTAYTALENCLQRNGFTSQADEVFMARKMYERRGAKTFDKFRSYLSQAFQGFGRRPQRVLYYDFAFILLGAFIFRRRKMVLKKPALQGEEGCKPETAEDCPPYNAFLYSLTLFAPTIDNQYTNNWRPAATHKKTRWYMTVQKWAGYVFVPLTIGIWTGIFK